MAKKMSKGMERALEELERLYERALAGAAHPRTKKNLANVYDACVGLFREGRKITVQSVVARIQEADSTAGPKASSIYNDEKAGFQGLILEFQAAQRPDDGLSSGSLSQHIEDAALSQRVRLLEEKNKALERERDALRNALRKVEVVSVDTGHLLPPGEVNAVDPQFVRIHDEERAVVRDFLEKVEHGAASLEWTDRDELRDGDTGRVVGGMGFRVILEKVSS